ncbi:hypothetical protein [Nonomuraea insulae]|uniref:Uncharacterized protein n=1 Tax=Nonomuraea insulae TaxID=1616787 RepID=A0ABW1CPS2_9ACTN
MRNTFYHWGGIIVPLVTVAYAISGWRMTLASKTTATQLNGADRVLYTDGTYRAGRAPRHSRFRRRSTLSLSCPTIPPARSSPFPGMPPPIRCASS